MITVKKTREMRIVRLYEYENSATKQKQDCLKQIEEFCAKHGLVKKERKTEVEHRVWRVHTKWYKAEDAEKELESKWAIVLVSTYHFDNLTLPLFSRALYLDNKFFKEHFSKEIFNEATELIDHMMPMHNPELVDLNNNVGSDKIEYNFEATGHQIYECDIPGNPNPKASNYGYLQTETCAIGMTFTDYLLQGIDGCRFKSSDGRFIISHRYVTDDDAFIIYGHDQSDGTVYNILTISSEKRDSSEELRKYSVTFVADLFNYFPEFYDAVSNILNGESFELSSGYLKLASRYFA